MKMRVRVTAGAAMVALASTPTWADTLANVFADPPATAKPWVRWWWPGGDVTDAELTREIGLLARAGFGGAEVQPFNPGIPRVDAAARARIDDYATPGFFAHMRTATRAAAAQGLSMDYTFGSAWPSGGGLAITPELALREVTMAITSVRGGQNAPIRVTLPPRKVKFGVLGALDARTRDPRAAGWRQRFDAIDRVVAVVAVRGTAPVLKPAPTSGMSLFPWRDVVTPGRIDPSSTVLLTDRLRADGTLDWTPPPGDWQIAVFKEYAANAGVSAGVGAGPQLTLDHFNADAFSAHAARVGDPLAAALGPRHPGLSGSFIDSLELMPDLYWSRDFLAEFRKRRGYDLAPYLPLVLQPGWMQAWGEHWSPPYFDAGDIGARVREDYRQTVSDLLIERFVEPFVAWNHARGLTARFQAHGAPADTLRAYGLADIPETEDLADAGNPYFMRLARSAADLYGREIVSAESLCWSARPFSVTLEDMRRRADLIFASGVNRLVVHGFPYAYQRDRWPGWHPFAPAAFGPGFSSFLAETNPLWAGVPRLTGYLARMQAVLQQGRPVVPVALFLGETGYYTGIETNGAHGDVLVRSLIEAGYDNDRINADALAGARVERGALVTAGGGRYAVLVLPPLDSIATETAAQVARFARAGLPVFFVDRPPARARGLHDAPTRDAAVAEAITAARRAGAHVTPAPDLATQLRAQGVAGNLRFVASADGLVFVQRQTDARSVYLIHNSADAPRDASFVTQVRGPIARWDAMDGTIQAIASVPDTAGALVPLRLDPGESALIVIGGAAARPAAAAAAERRPVDGWTLDVAGHGSDGEAVARAVPLPRLADFATVPGLADFSGVATYRTTVTVPAGWLRRGQRVTLDLGTVHDLATVTVNGRTLPPLIGAPWRQDLSGLLRPGPNDVAIAVANSPQNAVIDPARPGYRALRPVPAGLIGPVALTVGR